MNAPEIGIGLLGPAGIGQAHAHAYTLVRQVLWPPPAVPRLVRVSGRQVAKAELTRARYGFARAGERWQELVDDPAIQALDNCAPNHLHLEPSLAAIGAGKHVFCEKPLGRTAAEARALRDAAARAGIVHMVGFNYRFVPAVALTRRLIDEGRLGRIHHFRARFADASFLDPEAPFTWHQDAEAAGSNALLDLGSHLIDLARFLVGEPAAVSGATTTFVPERPDPATGRRRRVETEDAFEATVEFAGGALGSLSGTNMAAGRRAHMTFELNGSGGTVAFDLERLNSLSVHLRRAPDRRRPPGDPRDGPRSPVRGRLVAARSLDRLGGLARSRARPRPRRRRRPPLGGAARRDVRGRLSLRGGVRRDPGGGPHRPPGRGEPMRRGAESRSAFGCADGV